MPNVASLERTHEERLASLEKAKAARRARAEMKAKLKAGEVSIEAFLNGVDDNEVIARMPVKQFLCACPGIGAAHAKSIMETIGIAETRRVGGLGVRQKAALLEYFAK